MGDLVDPGAGPRWDDGADGVAATPAMPLTRSYEQNLGAPCPLRDGASPTLGWQWRPGADRCEAPRVALIPHASGVGPMPGGRVAAEWLEVMAAAADRVPEAAEQGQDDADQEHDDADGPGNGDVGDEADDEKDEAENNHGGLLRAS